MNKIRSRHYIIILLFFIYGLIKVPIVAYAATDTIASEQIVRLDLSDNTLQFGGFPSVRDEEELLDGILCDIEIDSVYADNSDIAETDINSKETAIDEIYALVSDSIDSQVKSIDVAGYRITPDAASEIVSDVLNDNPGYFYVNGVSACLNEEGVVDSVEVEYAQNTDEMNQEYEEAVWSIISQIDPEWNDEEKLFFLHDYLVTHCQYDLGYYTDSIDDRSYTPYGVVVLHKAVCSGYAAAFKDLACRVGTDVQIVSSWALDHAWNIVGLNGHHYYVDCTWDDPTCVYEGGPGGHGHHYDRYCKHTNFLRSQDGLIRTGHNTDDWVSNGQEIFDLYQDKSYDDADWHYTNSPVVCDDEGILFLDRIKPDEQAYQIENGIFRNRCDIKISEKIMDIDTSLSGRYPENEGNWYYWNYPTLIKTGNILVIDIADTIYSIDIKTETLNVLYKLTEAEREKGLIYGLEAAGPTVVYDIATGTCDLQKVCSGSLDLSDMITYVALDKAVVTFKGITGSCTLNYTVNSYNNPEVVWSTSDPSVAAVDNGMITPVGYGNAMITVEVNGVKAGCRVNVDTVWQDDYSSYDWDDGIGVKINPGNYGTITIPRYATINGINKPVKSVDLYGKELSIEKVKFENGIKPEYMYFDGAIKSIDLQNIDSGDLKVLSFSGCSDIESLDLSSIDTSRISDMSGMFSYCDALEFLNLSGWDTSNVTNMYSMFNGCNSLCSLDLSGWNTSNVTSMYSMFDGCKSLSSLDVSGWDTSNVTSMKYMFYGCKSLTSLDVSKWNTSKVTDMSGMFSYCEALESLDLSGWDMKNVVDVDRYAKYMFSGDYALNKITAPKNLSISISLPSKYKDKDGNLYTELPKDLTFSISLTKYIPLTSLKIYCGDDELNSRQWLSLRRNEERTLRAVAKPENADISSLIWTSSDPDSVSISSNGVVKAIKDIDCAVITASIPEDPITATAYVHVATKLEGVSIVPGKDITLMVGDTFDLAYVTIPEGVAVNSASWESSAPSVVSVDNTGKVTAKAIGEADITIELNDKFTDSIRINVVKKIIPIKEISLSSSSIDLDIGESQKLSVTKDPADSTDPVTYSSSNPKVASVDQNGYIKGISSGEADITVTCSEIVKSCHVKVYERLKKLSFEKKAYSIDLDETINITALITPAGFNVPVNWTVKGSEGIVSYTVSADQTVISIQGLSKGKVTITAAATDSTREPAIVREASCTVTVAGAAVIDPDDSGLIINGMEDEYIYTGQAVIPDVLIYYNGIRLVEKKEYTISCTNNKAPGTGYMTVKGKGNYAGASAMLPFSIVKGETGSISIKKASVYGINAKYTFTGSPIYVQDLKIVLGTNELSEGEDYTVSYRSHTDAGTASIVISGIGNYKDSIVKKFKITPADIRMAEMQPISAVYTSGGATPLPELTYTVDEDVYVLKYGVDYKVSWKNNGKPGTGSMIIQGQGNFAQKTTKEFSISQGVLNDTVIAVQSVKHKPGQTGSKYMNKVVVYDTNGKTLKAGKDYVLDYYDETGEMVINKGTPAGIVNNGDTIRVSIRPGTSGYYTGVNETDYPVVYDDVSISKQKAAAIPAQEYTGIEIRPEINIYGLTEGEDYEVAAYYNNTAKGNASVLILGKGKYSGYRILKFKIVARMLK